VERIVDIAVIGGGPAGLMAAGQAAGGGSVILLEGEERPGKKLLLTGKGRCNLSNTLPVEEFLRGFGPSGVFLRNGCHRFFTAELRSFLEGLGVETAIERGGRVYPAAGGAAAVLDALLAWIGSLGVRCLTGRRVVAATPDPAGGFLLSGEGFSQRARRLIIAAGGASYPQTGSRGDGCRLAAALGHRITPLHAALVPVRCLEPLCARLQGLRLRNVGIAARRSGAESLTGFGEVHFTPFGISGPAVFPLSAGIGEAAAAGPVSIEIDLKPGLDAARLDARLQREMGAGGGRPLARAMETLLPARLVPVFLDAARLDGTAPAARAGREARRTILGLLKGFPLTAVGTLPLEKGMVTAGGVDLREVHPATMASRLVPGLFFAGEVLDLDGDTGGYNLQAAFTTGFLAGRAAAGP
jgi:predicted Rossmann fold flavoprotein